MTNETENEISGQKSDTCANCGWHEKWHGVWRADRHMEIKGAFPRPCKKFLSATQQQAGKPQTPEYKTYPYRDGKKDGVELNRAVVTDKTSGDSVPDQFCLSSKRKYTKKDGLFDKLRVHSLDKHIVYPEEDVKEFLRRLKEEIWAKAELEEDGLIAPYQVDTIINKLAGERLK